MYGGPVDLSSARFKPAPDELVLKGVDPWNFRNRAWRRILERARIGHGSIKDLRHTYASRLLTAGIHLGCISVRPGHAGHNVTARHYGRWIPKEYVEPMRLLPGEVPADLLARLSSRPIRQTTSTPSERAAEQIRQGIERTPESIDPGAIRTPAPPLRRSEAILEIQAATAQNSGEDDEECAFRGEIDRRRGSRCRSIVQRLGSDHQSTSDHNAGPAIQCRRRSARSPEVAFTKRSAPPRDRRDVHGRLRVHKDLRPALPTDFGGCSALWPLLGLG